MGRILTFGILILLIATSCQGEHCKCEIDEDIKVENDSLVAGWINQPRNEYQNYWERFQEPLLNEQVNESYRLAITVLLSDYFKVYRIENINKDYNLYVKEYAISTTVSYREDSLVSDVSRKLSENEWFEITKVIKDNCYWTMPVDIKEDDGWLDGSGWTLEGINEVNNCQDTKYHFIYRHSPFATNDTSRFVKICEKFFELDSLKIRRF